MTRTHHPLRLVACALAALAAVSGCLKKNAADVPVATPAVTLSRPDPPLGSPIDVTYRFAVAADAKVGEDYWVMVHFLDPDREQMWTDDHQPPTPTTDWKPGQTITYTRTMFVPVFPYVGPATVEVGLFSPTSGARLPLSGEDSGQRSYRVATFDLRPQTDNLFLVYRDGWHAAEVAGDNSAVAWQWTRGDATITFRNPRKNVLFFLDVDSPVAAQPGGQQVQIRVGDTILDSFRLEPKGRILKRLPITAAQLGSGENADVHITVDKTFVPANVPELHSSDARELGVRVFHAYVQPQ